MNKYKVGDVVWLKGIVKEVDDSMLPYSVVLGDEEVKWFTEADITAKDSEITYRREFKFGDRVTFNGIQGVCIDVQGVKCKVAFEHLSDILWYDTNELEHVE